MSHRKYTRNEMYWFYLPAHERWGKMFVQLMGMHLCHNGVEVEANSQIPMVYPKTILLQHSCIAIKLEDTK